MKLFHTPSITSKIFPSVIWKVHTSKKELFLTFDDGPDTYSTPRILDMLDRYEAYSTFFVLGEKAALHQDIMQNVISKGHTIGNHSYSHHRLLFKSKSFIKQEILRTENALNSVLPHPPSYFRPPYGQLSAGLMNVARELSKTLVLWTLSSYDFKNNISENTIINRLLPHIEPGCILLFHEGQNFAEKTLNCLNQLIPMLTVEGYAFSSLPTDMSQPRQNFL